MKKPMWDSKAVKAYETGQGVELVNEPYLHYVPSQKKHEWVGLTDEEIEQVYMDTMNFQKMARALEAMLKERNT